MTLTLLWLEGFLTLTRQKWLGHIIVKHKDIVSHFDFLMCLTKCAFLSKPIIAALSGEKEEKKWCKRGKNIKDIIFSKSTMRVTFLSNFMTSNFQVFWGINYPHVKILSLHKDQTSCKNIKCFQLSTSGQKYLRCQRTNVNSLKPAVKDKTSNLRVIQNSFQVIATRQQNDSQQTLLSPGSKYQQNSITGYWENKVSLPKKNSFHSFSKN